ncbi:MAG: OmpA family protein [Chitinophagaceae bacterium]|nr:OmpA family protein [Chitinophagaceae bacterium]
MKNLRNLLLCLATASILYACNATKAQKGAVIGGTGGAVLGSVIGKAAGNKTLGTIIGAAVGGTAGAVIGNKMDKQAKEIENDIPGAKVERVGEGIVVEFSEKILFGYDQSDLTVAAKENLDKLVTILNKYPDTDMEIQGHTDSIGSDSYNNKLAERRALTVSSYLNAKGIASTRLNVKTFGEEAPKYDNASDEGRAQNRRVEFLVTANEKMKEEAKKEAENQ